MVVLWKPIEAVGKVVFPFGASDAYQLSLNAGDMVVIKGEHMGWFKGWLQRDETVRGIFPVNYVEIVSGNVANSQATHEMQKKHCVDVRRPSRMDPVVNEILEVLREWGSELKKLMDENKLHQFEVIKEKMAKLVSWRRQMLSLGEDEQHKREEIRQSVIKTIEEGAKALDLDIIVRVNKGEHKGQRADEFNSGVIELFRQYTQNQQREQEMVYKLHKIEEVKKKKNENKNKAAKGAFMRMRREEQEGEDESELMLNLPLGNSQLLLDIEACIFTVRKPTEIYFALYSATKKEFVTEEFMVELTDLGMPKDMNLIGKMRTIFKNLDRKEQWTSNLFLVCRIFRMGKIILEEKSNEVETDPYRRPFGVAILDLSPDVVREKLVDGREYAPEKLVIYKLNESEMETKFGVLHEMLISGQGSYERVPASQALGIALSVKLFIGNYEDIISENPKLADVMPTQVIGFPEFASPSDDRNELYLKLVKGIFAQGDGRNLEVSVKVFTENLNNMKRRQCLQSFSCKDSSIMEHTSAVYYHTTTPTWNEQTKIHLPPEELEKAIIWIEFSHCSQRRVQCRREKTFVSFLRVRRDDGLIIGDGDHKIDVYKYDKKIDGDMINFINDAERRQKFHTKNVFVLNTKLISTKVSQNAYLAKLFKWKEYKEPLHKLLDDLEKYIIIQDKIKYLREIFNSFFEILTYRSNADDAVVVFEALVHVIGQIVKHSQYHRLLPLVNEYIEERFKHSQIHEWLLNCYNLFLVKMDDLTYGNKLREGMKGISFMFKIIVASRNKYEAQKLAAEPTYDMASDRKGFRERVKVVVNLMTELMRKTEPPIFYPTQALTLKHMDTFWDSLAQIFDEVELGLMAREFIESVNVQQQITQVNENEANLAENKQNASNQNQKEGDQNDDKRMATTKNKLQALCEMAKGLVFIEDGARDIILPMLLQQIHCHINRSSDERTTCINMLCEMLHNLQTEVKNKAKMRESLQHILSLLPDLIISTQRLKEQKDKLENSLNSEHPPKGKDGKSASGETRAENHDKLLKEYAKLQHTRGNLFAVFMSIFYIIDAEMLTCYLNSMESLEARVTVFRDIYEVFNIMLCDNPTPEHWVAFSSFFFGIVVKYLQMAAEYMVNYFIPTNHEDFQFELWNGYFNLCFGFIQNARLQLEQFSGSKQSKLMKRHGDMRVLVVEHVWNIWTKLGVHQIAFVPQMVDPVLHIALSSKREIYKVAFNLYFSLVNREFKHHKKLTLCEGVTADVMNKFVVNGQLDDEYKEEFIKSLEIQFNEDPEIRKEGTVFVKQLNQLMELVASVQKYTDDDEEEKTSACMIVMEYLDRSNRQDLYFKYVHTLCGIHVHLKNYVESGLTLLLHADKLTWDESPKLDRFNDFPEQTPRQRKEKLYQMACEYFSLGKDYERAINYSKVLAQNFENKREYKKLAQILHFQGDCYDKIMEEKRGSSSCFYVAYYGKGFEEIGLMGKEFIYRGYTLEKLFDFITRISNRFPNAEIIQKTETPSDEIKHGNGQYIQILTVNASSHDAIAGKEVDTPEQKTSKGKYNTVNETDVFLFSRTWRKGKGKSDNDFKDLYTTKTFFITKDKFPTIHRRSPIIEVKEVTLTPIENAIVNIETNISKFAGLVKNHREEEKPDFNTLSMSLSGTIDAAVNGGVTRYLDAFFCNEYLKEHRDSDAGMALIKRLRDGLAQQNVVLSEALVEHGKRAKGDLYALQVHLEDFFGKMKETLHDPLARDLDAYVKAIK